MLKPKKQVRLVTTEILTPFRAAEVINVTEEEAEQLLHINLEKTDFGPRYPKVKVRKFVPGQDDELLLNSRSLTGPEHRALLEKIRPDLLADYDEEMDYQPEEEAEVTEEKKTRK